MNIQGRKCLCNGLTGGRHTASRDIWQDSPKKGSVSVNNILVYGLQHSSGKAEFEQKKKQLKTATHLLWNVNRVFPENMGQKTICCVFVT